MTTADLLQLVSALPDGADVTLTVKKEDLAEALATTGGNPQRLVSTSWCAEHLGMSREWWAKNAEHVDGARQQSEGKPWYLPAGEASAYLERYFHKRSRTRRRRRGPQKRRER